MLFPTNILFNKKELIGQ